MSSFRRRLRWATTAVVSVIVASTLAACSSSGSNTGNGEPSGGAGSAGASSAGALDPNKPVSIRVADAGVSNLLAVAKAEGFFKSYGLDPTLSQTQSGVATLAAIQGGSLDIGYADFYAGVNAIKNGFDVDFLLNNNTNLDTFPVLVKADGPIKTVADLAGKKIGVSPVPQFAVNTDGYLKANGVDPSSVKLVTISDATGAPQALERGDFDAWAAASWPAVYTNNGKVGNNFKVIGNVETKGWTTPAATTAGWWSKASYAKGHAAVASAFANAVRAFRIWWYKQSAADQAALIKKYYDVDYAALAGGDPQVLQRLVNYVAYQSTPIDLAATQTWYELGVQYAGEAIAKDVDWQSHVFASAKQPAPTTIPTPTGG